jgi:hypothetical protein
VSRFDDAELFTLLTARRKSERNREEPDSPKWGASHEEPIQGHLKEGETVRVTMHFCSQSGAESTRA